MIEIYIPDDAIYDELQDLLDNGDDSIRVTAYQTYTMDEIIPYIMKRKEVEKWKKKPR